MSSLLQVEMGRALTRTKAFATAGVTTWPAMQIQYIGTSAFGGVAIASGGDMTLTADDVDGITTVHSTAGIDGAGAKVTTGVIDLSTPHASVDTFGELNDYINALPDFRSFLIGVLPSQLTNNKLAALSACATGYNGPTLFADAAVVALDQGFAFTNDKFLYRPKQSGVARDSGRTTNELCTNGLQFLHVNLTAVGDSNIEIYAIDDDLKTEVLLWDNATATAVAEEHGATAPETGFIQAPEGKKLLVYFDNAAANSAADVHAIGFTRHRLGGNVPGANYTGII